MIYVYGDISGKPHTRVLVAACYIGGAREWAAVDRRWAAALRDARVDHFHATDFFACQGAFKGWKRGSKRHRDAEKAFTLVARSHQLMGFSFGVESVAFPSVLKPALAKVRAPQRIRSLRLFCVLLCLERIARYVREFPLPAAGAYRSRL